MRIGDTGERLVIQWISKGWTTHELQLPVFYRKALGRLLALEKFQNLIETNIEAGITLYTDHKPALFENSLSNKGQLSAWKLAEVSNLLSIVENLYRQGGNMLFADPLSRFADPVKDGMIPHYQARLPLCFDTPPRRSGKCRKFACMQERIPVESLNYCTNGESGRFAGIIDHFWQTTNHNGGR